MNSSMNSHSRTSRPSQDQVVLFFGDVVALALVTLAGFASHNILDRAPERIWATFIPWVVSWVLVAPFLGAFDLNRIRKLAGIWRPVLAIVLATPLAGVLRALWLDVPIQWVFVAVLVGTGGLGLGLWRLAFWLLWGRGGAVRG